MLCSPDHLAAAIRQAAFALDVFGFGLTAYGIDRTWQFSGGLGARKAVARFVRACVRAIWAALAWLSRQLERLARWVFRRPKRRDVSVAGTTAAAGLGAAQGAIATIGWPPPGTTVEERLDWLEQQVHRIQDDLDHEREARDQGVRSLRSEVDAERAARAAGDAEAHAKIKEFAGKDLWIAALGLLILLVAVPGSTIPVGTAHALRSIVALHQPRCASLVR